GEAGTLARNGAWHGGGAPKAAGAASGARPRGGGEEKRRAPQAPAIAGTAESAAGQASEAG
ncbi:MAG: hypothetical protein ACXWNE_12955, partial [Candidatus Binataceae bacterium]